MSGKQPANALINETSPYLLQHAHNPVYWYPWGEEAIQRARQEGKPILISIGYSACHWCHVMAHESFEDKETAELMNRFFINVKVDREERPDLDKIYQTAQQLLTQRAGGWPLTMFLTPEDHIPFFGGTYFPLHARYGMPGFKDILRRVREFFQQEQEAISQQNRSLMEAFQRMQTEPGAGREPALNPRPLIASIHELTQAFDKHHGGFGGAPKFPTPTNIERLLHHHELYASDEQILPMALLSLKHMALGGIYDQLGGGFCRYSVDQQWLIPHFEKMLYDNGSLLSLYAGAWQISAEPLFKKVAVETADWLTREMQSPEGGYYSSLDADSEGEEGRFYLWTPEQVKALLTADEYDLFSVHTGLDLPANFEGKWHLHISRPIDTLAASFSMDVDAATEIINRIRRKLYDAREQRIRPGRDEKILTSWNALTIKGMAVAANRFGRRDYLASAEKALTFIHDTMWRDKRLLATCKDGKAHLNAYLDDYAFLIDALLSLLAASWSGKWLQFATQLAEQLLDNYYDKENGGFFFTSHDHERLLQRRKDFMDDALPSGNGVAAAALARLGHLINEPRFTEASERTLKAAWSAVERMPSACNALLFALEDYCFPPRQIILTGRQEVVDEWKKQCTDASGIRSQVFAIARDALPGLPAQRQPGGDATAYICEGFSCLEPITDAGDLLNHLKKPKPE
ncbi:MAG: thioredoxin domain-containing protein [Gammaproteobacteria bacterium]